MAGDSIVAGKAPSSSTAHDSRRVTTALIERLSSRICIANAGQNANGFVDESHVPSQDAASAFSPEMQVHMKQQMAQAYPNIVLMAGVAQHDDSVVGHGRDDEFEFEFAFTLDVMLDGFERPDEHGWTSKSARQTER